jgi:hypothetical protein
MPKQGGAFGETHRVHEARNVCRANEVVLVAEHGTSVGALMEKLRRRGHTVRVVVQDRSEAAGAFRERVACTLRSLASTASETYFVAAEPIGPRLLAMIRAIVSALPRGARVILCAGAPSATATRALSALAMTVGEMARDVDISVDGASGPAPDTSPDGWRLCIDRTLYRLLKEPQSMRTNAA